MFINRMIYFAVLACIALLLNATLFKSKPATRPVSWVLSILIFIINVVALSALKIYEHAALVENIGFPLKHSNPLDFTGGFIFAWLFYGLLKRKVKEQKPPSNEDPK